MNLFNQKDIQSVIDIKRDFEAMIASQKSAFIDFSQGLYDVPLPMQFIFKDYQSDCHIKSAYKQGNNHFVLKVASSSPFGNNGIILAFAADTGTLKAILEDEGYLTTLRTAITGIIVSELIPWRIRNIGIIGSGHLAKMLHALLCMKYPNTNLWLYARNHQKAAQITDSICDSVDTLVNQCDLIFTATSSEYPIIHDLKKEQKQAIIALGSDDVCKRELSLEMYAKSELVIVDSKQQALKLGDVSKALTSHKITQDSLIELGRILLSNRAVFAKTIIADFSGIGAQDVAMTEFFLSRI